MKRFFYVLIFGILLHSCSSSTENEQADSILIQKKSFQELRNQADQRDAESLIQWFQNENPKLREQVCLVSGSVQDSILLPHLYNSLKDSLFSIRKLAAWSIGQTGNSSSYPSLFNHLEFEFHQDVRQECFKAIAKCLPPDSLSLYFKEPTAGSDIEGWLKGIYQIILRNRDWAELPDVIPFLAHPQEEVRLMAAHILSRSAEELTENESAELELRMLNEASNNVRMAMVSALRKSKTQSTSEILFGIILDENEHPGVRVNAIRSIKALNIQAPPGMVVLLNGLDNIYSDEVANWMISFPASIDFILNRDLENISKSALAILMSAAIKNHSESISESDYLRQLNSCTNLYDKMSFIGHLPESKESIEFATNALDTCKKAPLLTSFAEAISTWDWSKLEVENLLLKLSRKGDEGATALIAETLALADRHPKPNLLESLDSVRQVLSLPREVETYNAIVNALKIHRKDTLSAHRPEYNHPIDWSLADSLKESVFVTITTTKGEIELELYPYAGPATVIDFLRLAKEKYYNGKSFHRVVPNFVIQGGCPRGDGYGSLDYSIRSEFSPLSYPTGTIGMASAGKDTESCQWFITHSPTPHLEGRYTSFGRVTRGMEVVWAIQVGDRIREVTIKTN